MGIDFIVLFVLVGDEILLWNEMYFESNLIKIRTCGLIVAQQSCLATAVLLYSFLCNCLFVFLCLCNCVFFVFVFGHGSCILM